MGFGSLFGGHAAMPTDAQTPPPPSYADNGSGMGAQGGYASSTGGYGHMGSSTHAMGMPNIPVGGAVRGSITAISADSITVTDASSTTHIIDITSSTKIQSFDATSHQMTTLSVGDLKTGESVFVLGQPQSDGSISAMMISEGTSFPTPGSNGGVRLHGGVNISVQQ